MGVFEDVLSHTSKKPGGFPSVLKIKGERRVPPRRVSRSAMTSHLWELELLPSRFMKNLAPDIGRLSRRSVENNLFFEPDFLTAAYPRLTRLLTPGGNWMACLWETTPESRTLRFFMPLAVLKTGLPRHEFATSLSHDYAPLGTPLLCNDLPDETAENLLRLLASPELGLPGILHLKDQRLSGRTMAVLEEAAHRLGLPVGRALESERAALFPVPAKTDAIRESIGSKRQREYARQVRRLGETGQVSFEVAREREDVLDAFEGFLALELKGWKGRRGTALYNQKRITAFSRQTVDSLSSQGACEVHSMKFDGQTIASLIVLGHGGELFTWKTAFNEAFAQASPGVQVMLRATEDIALRPDLKSVDSLAVANHPMIDHIWRGRLNVGSMLIGLNSRSHDFFGDAVSALEKENRLKQRAKAIIAWARCILRNRSLRDC